MATRKHRNQTVSRLLLAGVLTSVVMALGGLIWPNSASHWTPEKARELNSMWTALHQSTERPSLGPSAYETEIGNSGSGIASKGNVFRAKISSLQEKSAHDDAIRHRYHALQAELEAAKAEQSRGIGSMTRFGLVAAILFGAAYLAQASGSA